MTSFRSADLVLTNGESGARAVISVLPDVDVLAWNDVLHDGPVSASGRLDEVSAGRVEFLTRTFSAMQPERDISAEFRRRDETFREALRWASPERRVVLWFESDVYDQLQFCQIISFAGGAARQLYFVPWSGSLLAGDGRLEQAVETARRLTLDEISCAEGFWAAFTSSSPDRLASMAVAGDVPLNSVHKTILRLLAEYPGSTDGLSTSERRIVQTLLDGPLAGGQLFRSCIALEDDPFVGDWTFFRIVDRLVDAEAPLVGGTDRGPNGRYELSQFGREVALGSEDFLSRNGIDRWIGGVHLSKPLMWRWNESTRRLEAASTGR